MPAQTTDFKLWYALSLGLQLGFIIVVPIAGFIFIGYKIDQHFSTHPLFLMLGIFVGLAITAYEVYEWLLPLVKNPEEK